MKAIYWLGLGLFLLGAIGTPVVGYLDVEATLGTVPKGKDHGPAILVLGGVITLTGLALSVLSLFKLRSSKLFARYLMVLGLLVLATGALYAFLLAVAK